MKSRVTFHVIRTVALAAMSAAIAFAIVTLHACAPQIETAAAAPLPQTSVVVGCCRPDAGR